MSDRLAFLILLVGCPLLWVAAIAMYADRRGLHPAGPWASRIPAVVVYVVLFMILCPAVLVLGAAATGAGGALGLVLFALAPVMTIAYVLLRVPRRYPYEEALAAFDDAESPGSGPYSKPPSTNT